MSGNVFEWSADVWDYRAYGRYKRGELSPPSGGGASEYRMLRGGSWAEGYSGLFRCAYHEYNHLDDGNRDRGFRVAKTLTP
jgi:formylglycine-generating enzyme required for sulfatase activity